MNFMMGCQLVDKADIRWWATKERGVPIEEEAEGGVYETRGDTAGRVKRKSGGNCGLERTQTKRVAWADWPVLIVDLVAEARRVDDRQLHGHALLLDVCTQRHAQDAHELSLCNKSLFALRQLPVDQRKLDR